MTGNGRHLDSGSAGADPTTSTDGNLNGQPVVVFDGSSDFLVSTAAASVYNGLHDGVARGTAWAVVRRTDSPVAYRGVWDNVGANTFRGGYCYSTSSGFVEVSLGNGSGTYCYTATTATNMTSAESVLWDHVAADRLRITQFLAASSPVVSDTTIAGSLSASDAGFAMTVGRNAQSGLYFWQGNIAELIFAKGLTNDEVTAVNAILGARYSLLTT